MEDIVVEDEEKTLLIDICYENQIDKQEESVIRAMCYNLKVLRVRQ